MTDRDLLDILSPGSLLARVFPSPGEPSGALPCQLLISGPRGCGKSTWCQALAQAARQEGIAVYGLLSPTGAENGRREWIDLIDLPSGERVRLADRRRGRPASPHLETKTWHFDPHSLLWGSARLEALFSQPMHAGIFIIDELGPLEFERGLGFVRALDLFNPPRARLSVAVIRPELLAAAQARWPAAQVMRLPERRRTPGSSQ